MNVDSDVYVVVPANILQKFTSSLLSVASVDTVVSVCLSMSYLPAGELKYCKNGRKAGILMHVDCSLPLWAFFDIYGSTNKLESLGMVAVYTAASNFYCFGMERKFCGICMPHTYKVSK